MNLAFSLRHGDWKGTLRVESITLRPTLYAGAADQCLSACFLKASMNARAGSWPETSGGLLAQAAVEGGETSGGGGQGVMGTFHPEKGLAPQGSNLGHHVPKGHL